MKTYYSILKCATRPTVDEEISIALFLISGEKTFFRYSHSKLDVIKGLLPSEAYGLLKSNLKNIDNYISKKNANLILANTEEHFLGEKYFTYLSNYATNLITFTEPKRIELPCDADVFEKLYNKFIFETDEEKIRDTEDPIIRVKRRINPKIESHVNLDIHLTTNHFSALTVPTKVWFAGENEQKVTGETTDFSNKSAFHLENHLRSYLYLIDKIKESTKGNKKGQFFLVGNEPQKKLNENHKLWAAMREQKNLTYLPYNEADAIKEYMERHGVTPLVKDKVIKESI